MHEGASTVSEKKSRWLLVERVDSTIQDDVSQIRVMMNYVACPYPIMVFSFLAVISRGQRIAIWQKNELLEIRILKFSQSTIPLWNLQECRTVAKLIPIHLCTRGTSWVLRSLLSLWSEKHHWFPEVNKILLCFQSNYIFFLNQAEHISAVTTGLCTPTLESRRLKC